MAFDYLSELTGKGKGFALQHAPGANPLVHTFDVTPATELIHAGGRDGAAKLALDVTETVTEPVTTLLREVQVDLPLVGKWVRLPLADLGNLDPLSEDPIGGMPVARQLQQLSGLTTGLTTTLSTNLPPASLMESEAGKGNTAGIPALLGSVKGVLNETVKELREVTRVLDPLGVTARVRIRVVDDADPSSTVVTDRIEVSLPGATGWQALTALPAAGTALLGANPFSFSLRLAPLFSELRGPTPDVAKVSVYVSVDLEVQPPSVAGVAPAPVKTTIDLPAVPLVLPTVPIPTIVVLCEHSNFLGRKLVVVPSDSLLGKAVTAGGKPIGEALSLTNQVIKSLQTVLTGAAGALAFSNFLDGAAAGAAGMTSSSIASTMPASVAAAVLSSIAEAPGQTQIVASSQLTNLDNYVFDPGGWFGVGRFTGSDMASSVIVVGRPGTTVSFGQHAGWPGKQELTPLTITLGANQLGCAISELGPSVPFGTGYAYDPNDPASFTTTVFGGSITSFSPKQNHDQIYSLGITRPAAGFSSAA